MNCNITTLLSSNSMESVKLGLELNVTLREYPHLADFYLKCLKRKRNKWVVLSKLNVAIKLDGCELVINFKAKLFNTHNSSCPNVFLVPKPSLDDRLTKDQTLPQYIKEMEEYIKKQARTKAIEQYMAGLLNGNLPF